MICLSNSFFNSFKKIKTKSELRFVFHFSWKWKTNEDIKNSKKKSILKWKQWSIIWILFFIMSYKQNLIINFWISFLNLFYQKHKMAPWVHEFIWYVYLINPFHATGLFLYCLKISFYKIPKFPDVFTGYRKRPVAWPSL